MKKLLLALIVLTQFLSAKADSPLTSTDFYRAYLNESIVLAASKAEGVMDVEYVEYMMNSKNPIAVKMALINAMGYSTDGSADRSTFFTGFMETAMAYHNIDVFLAKGTADEILCLAYITAMDNYNNVTDAIKYAEIALKKNPNSYTFNLITALIKSQSKIGDQNSWCSIYSLCDKVRQNSVLKVDMKPEAASIIFEYTDLYKEYCKETETKNFDKTLLYGSWSNFEGLVMEDIKFNSDGTYVHHYGNDESKGKWKLENGILTIFGVTYKVTELSKNKLVYGDADRSWTYVKQ